MKIQTPRLNLRPLENRDLPRFPEFLNEWEVTKWLIRVPFPYSINDAEWFYNKMAEETLSGKSIHFVIAEKSDDRLIGFLGYHEPSAPQSNTLEIGYWLAKPYWGKGYMSETLQASIPLVLTQTNIVKLVSFTDPANQASQNVLRKAGLRYLGIGPRVGEGYLRGSTEVTLWEMTREDFSAKTRL